MSYPKPLSEKSRKLLCTGRLINRGEQFPSFGIYSLTKAQHLRSGYLLCPGIQKAFADGTMDKKYLVRKRKKLGWKVSE